jgi:hypothetical protein
MTDPNVESVRKNLLKRSKVGIKKYGCTTAKAGLTTLQWLKHAQEESMDFSIYLKQLIRDERKRNRNAKKG